MKQLSISILLVFLTLNGFSQNYYQEYPINSVITFNGNQQRLECSTYDSVLQTTVTYQTPLMNNIIISSNYSGKVVFTTWVTPGQQDNEYGFIIYDHLLHQYDVQLKSRNLTPTMQFNVNAGSHGVVVTTQTESGGYYHVGMEYFRYNIFTHKWTTCNISNDPDTGPITWGNGPYNFGDFVGIIHYDDELDLYYYDPGADVMQYVGSGCAGWGYFQDDDYIAMDTGCLDNYAFLTYDPEIHSFVGYGVPNLLGSVERGIFRGYNQDVGFPSYIFTYDQDNQQYVTDSSHSETITSVVLKNRSAAYIDQPIGGSAKVIYMVYNPIIHNFVKDSATVAGTATGLAIENGTVKWTDANGLNIRGYDVNQGWGNFTTPIFLNFQLTDLSSQGLPMIHVRNYSLGTDHIYYDFGDGVTSLNNRHVLWHSYRDSGSYDVCIYDSSGIYSSCQQINYNFCSTSGTMAISNDTICQGDSVILSLINYTGNIQWQSKTNGAWIDETGTGSTTNNYTINPSKSATYRAVVINGNCMPAMSNSIFLKVYENISNAVISDTLVSTCSGQSLTLFVLNVNASYQWQQNSGSGWSNIQNATYYAYTSSPIVNILYRVVISSGSCFIDTTSIISVMIDSMPSVPVVIPDFTCGPGVVDLQASSSGNINWYESSVLDSIIHIGNTYSPYINSNTTYKVKSTTGIESTIGYSDNSIGNLSSMSNERKGLRINCADPATLTAVYVYPQQSGFVLIRLYDAVSGHLISTTSKNVTAGNGKVKIPWNNVPLRGNRIYDMMVEASSVPLEVNTSGIIYPITNAGSPVSILGYVDSLFHNSSDFYNIYELTLSTGCQSGFANIDGSVYPEFSNANIVPSGQLVFCQGDSVKLNTFPIGSYTYQWLKNGLSVGSAGNSYIAKTPGTYQVVMNNSNGCVDTSSAVSVRVPCIPTFDPISKSIGEDEMGSSQFNVLYNGDNEELNISIFSKVSGNYNVKIIDQSGREVINENQELSAGEHKLSYNIHAFSNGIYVAKVESAQTRILKKFIKY